MPLNQELPDGVLGNPLWWFDNWANELNPPRGYPAKLVSYRPRAMDQDKIHTKAPRDNVLGWHRVRLASSAHYDGLNRLSPPLRLRFSKASTASSPGVSWSLDASMPYKAALTSDSLICC